MFKTYLPKHIHFLILFVSFILYLLGFYFSLLLVTCIYLLLLAFFRYGSYRAKELSGGVTEGVIFAPCSGKVMDIDSNYATELMGEGLTKIRISMSILRNMGIYLPLTCEVEDSVSGKGEPIFRYSKKWPKEGGQRKLKADFIVLRGVQGVKVGIKFTKCIFGGNPDLWLLPGDRGKRMVNMGYFPMGGTVELVLPAEYRVQAKVGDKLAAAESVLASRDE